jgi:hypothetical protein
MLIYPLSILPELKLLSSSPSLQVKYLEKNFNSNFNIKSNIDELALEFHDRFLLAPQWLENGKIFPLITESLKLIDRKHDQISGPENIQLKRVYALQVSREWEEIQKLSKSCLELFDGN